MLQTPARLSKDRCADLATTIKIGFWQEPAWPDTALLTNRQNLLGHCDLLAKHGKLGHCVLKLQVSCRKNSVH
jgi:hypothetical protein